MIRRQKIRIIFLILSSFSLHTGYTLGDNYSADIDFGQYTQADQKQTQQKAKEKDPQSAFSRLVDLTVSANYYTTNKLIFDAELIDFANLGYQVSIDLSCRGSGSILRPFKSAKVLLEKKPVVSSVGEVTITFTDAFMDSARSQFNRHLGSDFDLMKKLSGFELSPLHVFMIKMILLARTEVDQAHFAQEAAKLMMRLSITEPYRSNMGASLTTLFNLDVQDNDLVTVMLSSVLVKVLPQDWMTALQSMVECIKSPAAYNAGMKTKVLIFGKNSFDETSSDPIIEGAKNFINACEDKTTCLEKLNEFLTQRGYEVSHDFDSFAKFRWAMLNQSKKPSPKVNPFVNKVCFLGSIHDIPVIQRSSTSVGTKKMLRDFNQSEATLMDFDDYFGTWIVFPSASLNIRDSACAMTALLIKAFQDYVAAKFPLILGVEGKNLDEMDQTADKQALVRAFLLTEEGQRSQERLTKELKGLCTFGSAKIEHLIVEAKKELAVLKKQQKSVEKKLALLLENYDYFGANYCKEKQQELEDQEQGIVERIELAEQKIADYSAQINNPNKKVILLQAKLHTREEAIKAYEKEAARFQIFTLEDRVAYEAYLSHLAHTIRTQNRMIREFLIMEEHANAHHAMNVSKYENLRLALASIINDNEFFGLPVDAQCSVMNFDFMVDDLGGNNPAFDGVRAFLDQAKTLLKQSTLLKENKLMAEYLVRLLFPSYASYLAATLLE